MTNAKYSKITDGDDATSSSHRGSRGMTDDGVDAPVKGFRRAREISKTLLIALCLVVFALICYTFGRYSKGFEERKCADTAWDEIRDAVHFKTLNFNPRFTGPPSPYMGTPNPNVDRLWYDLAALRNFGVDRFTLEKVNQTKGAVQYPGTGRYQVGVEAFHQLHCLNYVRMYTYQDHYGKIDYDMVAESAEERREHKDHCVEVLRQRLMCNPDLNVYPYHWVEQFDRPVGHLFTRHRCVDWELFHSWADDNTVNLPAVIKPEDADIWS